MNYLIVLVGGAIGSVARYGTGVLTKQWFGPDYPWSGTLAVNLIGGFCMGLLVAILTRTGGSEQTRLLIGVGVLGGFTTFSAFSLETFLMLERSQYGVLALYVGTSVIGSVLSRSSSVMSASVTSWVVCPGCTIATA